MADLRRRDALWSCLHDEPFIGSLAFRGPADPVEEAKLGMLAGPLLSVMIGYLMLRFAPPPKPHEPAGSAANEPRMDLLRPTS